MKNNYYLFRFSVNLISFIITIGFWMYLRDLLKNANKCTCADSEKVSLMKKLIEWLVLLFFVSLVFSYIFVFSLNFIRLILFCYMVYVFIKFDNNTTRKACECAVDNRRTLYRYKIYVTLIIISLGIIGNFLTLK
jgi:hypothetical protein